MTTVYYKSVYLVYHFGFVVKMLAVIVLVPGHCFDFT